MSKFYLLPLVFLVMQASAQQSSPNLIPVQQGQSFSIRSPYSVQHGNSTLKNIIRIVGIGALAYGSEQTFIHSSPKAGITTTVEKNRWLLPIGAGLTVSAGQLAALVSHKK